MKIKGTEFFIGSDPEVFLKDRRTRRYVSAHGVTEGTKDNPRQLGPGSYIQVDGMALEFNTAPRKDAIGFGYEVACCKELIHRLILNKRNTTLAVESTVEFDDEEWERVPDIAKDLGCNADYCAWNGGRTNPSPDATVKYRTGAGHIQLGRGKNFKITKDYMKICGQVAKELDATVGVASLLYDPDTKRRSLYGKAGAFRPTHFGVEYRVLSNRWVRNLELSTYVANLSFRAIYSLMSERETNVSDVENIINNGDVSSALYWLVHNKTPLPPKRQRIY